MLALIWLVLGIAMVAVSVWLGWTRWLVLNGHLAMLIAGIACGLLGFIAVAWAIGSLAVGGRQDREGDPKHPAHRTSKEVLRRAHWRIIFAVPALVLAFLLVVVLAYARPFVATPTAAAAFRSEWVRLADRLGWYELIPVRQDASGDEIRPTAGLVFVPGARIDSRAYANVLRPLAEAGYLVAVLKEPFGFSFLDADHGKKVLDVHPEITDWAVGGHSLGGHRRLTCRRGRTVKGLVLFASYPGDRLVRDDLKAVSISGTADGFTTPADIEASKENLPPATSYVVINGAVHSSFGDYGEQPGDGIATVDRTTAQAEINNATLGLLASLAPPPPPPPKKK